MAQHSREPDDRFPDAQTFRWGVRQNQGPLGHLPLLSGHCSSMPARFLFQLLASLFNHFLRHTDRDQSQWELVLLTKAYLSVLSHLDIIFVSQWELVLLTKAMPIQ